MHLVTTVQLSNSVDRLSCPRRRPNHHCLTPPRLWPLPHLHVLLGVALNVGQNTLHVPAKNPDVRVLRAGARALPLGLQQVARRYHELLTPVAHRERWGRALDVRVCCACFQRHGWNGLPSELSVNPRYRQIVRRGGLQGNLHRLFAEAQRDLVHVLLAQRCGTTVQNLHADAHRPVQRLLATHGVEDAMAHLSRIPGGVAVCPDTGRQMRWENLGPGPRGKALPKWRFHVRHEEVNLCLVTLRLHHGLHVLLLVCLPGLTLLLELGLDVELAREEVSLRVPLALWARLTCAPILNG